MGGLERQQEKADRLAAELTAGRLEPDESIEVVVTGHTRIRLFLWLILPSFPGMFLLEYTGRGSWSVWILAFCLLLIFTLVVRYYLIVLTDRRLLILQFRRMSNSKVEIERSLDPRSLTDVSWREGMLTGVLRIQVGPGKYEIEVSSAFVDRAEEMTAKLESKHRQPDST